MDLIVDVPIEYLGPEDKSPISINMCVLKVILKFQRALRRRRAMRAALADHHWRLFSELDSKGEADMLELSSFTNSLMDSSLFSLSTQIIYESMSIDTIDVCGVISNQNKLNDKGEYCLEQGSLTQTNAKEIINTLRAGRNKLSVETVHKILRHSYAFYTKAANISHISITSTEKINIIGDIHGQLSDLLHILDEAGDPNSHNKYIFNGDFVDRGTHSIEVILILLILQIVYPEYVYLNRGNHEDFSICSMYGFQKECKEKYNLLTFNMFAEMFRYIPLFASKIYFKTVSTNYFLLDSSFIRVA